MIFRAHASTSIYQPHRYRRLLASTLIPLVLTVALLGCSDTVDNADWLGTTMRDDLAALGTAMDKATQTSAGQRAPSPETCSVLNDWATEADSHPRPEDEVLSAAWDEVLAAVDSFATDVCPSGDMGAIAESNGRIQGALGTMQDRIAAM